MVLTVQTSREGAGHAQYVDQAGVHLRLWRLLHHIATCLRFGEDLQPASCPHQRMISSYLFGRYLRWVGSPPASLLAISVRRPLLAGSLMPRSLPKSAWKSISKSPRPGMLSGYFHFAQVMSGVIPLKAK